MWFNRIAVAEPAVKITRAWGCFYAPVESSCGFDHNIFSSHLIMCVAHFQHSITTCGLIDNFSPRGSKGHAKLRRKYQLWKRKKNQQGLLHLGSAKGIFHPTFISALRCFPRFSRGMQKQIPLQAVGKWDGGTVAENKCLCPHCFQLPLVTAVRRQRSQTPTSLL